jgi:hypothetical protein
MLIIKPLPSPIFQNNIGVHSGPNFRAAQGNICPHYSLNQCSLLGKKNFENAMLTDTIFLSCRSKRCTQSFSPLCTDLVLWACVSSSHGSCKLQPRPCSSFHTSISKTKSLVLHICWMYHSLFLHTLLQVLAPLHKPCV